MSKWVKSAKYKEFLEQRMQEQDSVDRNRNTWAPEKGTEKDPNTYHGRFLQDPEGRNYKKILYHLYRRNDGWQFVLCQKTFDFNNFCSFCSLTSALYQGTENDKKMAKGYKRKEKFAGNFFVIEDPRDSKKENDDYRAAGKNWVYEFPKQVESKLLEEMKDEKEGLGEAIFDPGEDGHTFILKVGATKPMTDGTTFPDYANSKFASKASAIGSDKEIGKIMETVVDLEEHVKNMAMSDEDMKALIEEELLWDYVERDWKKFKGSTEVKEEKESEEEPKSKKEEKDPKPESDEDDLMKELDDLKNS
ncbi:MAG: hypothetical protein WC503_03005 [Candidatus Shapirobacteria bacterium]